MTEEEWNQTPAAQAVLTYTNFMMSVVMNIIGGALGGLVTKGLSWLAKKKAESAGATPERISSVLDPLREDSLRNALVLIASWSAFEACIEDFCKGVLQADMSIVGNERFEKIKIPVAELVAPQEEMLDNVYQAMDVHVGRKAGTNRFEELLGLLGLGGQIAKEIKSSFYAAQMVRNVWAHKAGIADRKFVSEAPHLGYVQGDLVSITFDQVNEYVTAILVYAQIVMNRHRAKCGLGPAPMGGDGPNHPLIDAYLGMYPSLQPSGEAAPPAT
ncbi:hypothetical protein AWB92_19065 [Mycobacterium sp. IEC1808]|uniref:hypothetical protein n=1 Tax=Mycobacterium sp. IEC1808 TaxID=1743230 RepID=UPI000A152A18|nr:hypothetical protein [Mycobacterium sp. IEC1808]ORW91279.1 hypothetical protein AWB92_19065 [Mycobacterium sp. IEC1808]